MNVLHAIYVIKYILLTPLHVVMFPFFIFWLYVVMILPQFCTQIIIIISCIINIDMYTYLYIKIIGMYCIFLVNCFTTDNNSFYKG